jgi:hypothetical protein
VIAFERAQMLVGGAARLVYFDLEPVNPNLSRLLPSDLDGPAPPVGAPNYFAAVEDTSFGYATDRLQVFEFHVDWNNTANSTFTGPLALDVAPFTPICPSLDPCIPQPGTAVMLEGRSDRLMYRLQYRNFGTHQTLVTNHVVDTNGMNHAGLRWYELRKSGANPWSIFQQGTFAPDAHHRWMGSAAMDGPGNIAVGYSVSSSTVFPSARYAGRIPSDPAGTLAQGEASLMVGSGSQTDNNGR